MGYQVLARKWRPGKFSELVGQEHVVRAISNALDNNRLHHAYLFTGTRGVGKTTIARIFSRSLNCETGVSSNPCGVCPACLDIEKGSYVDLIEIDAASRTKVEDTREILDNVQYRPSRGEYKVYLIDEVHMLSKSSFNALLKTLEEPPPHIKFLLATTDPQKLPITILSRCLQFNLKALTREQIGGQLSHILKAENIAFETKALELLARSAHGSMRDALSLTDQAIAQGNGQVMPDVVSEMLGLIDADQISNLVRAIFEKDKIRVLEISSELALMGSDFKAALAELMSVFHQIALTQFVPEACKLETSQARQIYGWARAITPELVQLYYQIALQGRKDIEWAQDLKVGFEMAVMRMMAFTPEAIKIDVSDLQVNAQEANQKHSGLFASPPPSLLVEDDGEKEIQQSVPQPEPEQKKNELNSDHFSVDNDRFSVERESGLLGDEARSSDNVREQTKPDGVSGPDLISQTGGSEPLHIEPVKAQSMAVESTDTELTDVGTAEVVNSGNEADKQHQALTAEMDALIQEAQGLKPNTTETVQQAPDIERQVGQPEVKDVFVAPQSESPQPPLQTEPQTADSSLPNVPGIDDYADYDSLQQASEQDYSELNVFDAMEQGSANLEKQSGHSTVQLPEQDPAMSKGSTANTHDLLNLMQTLNQATTESTDPLQEKSQEQLQEPQHQPKQQARQEDVSAASAQSETAFAATASTDTLQAEDPQLAAESGVPGRDESHNDMPAANWGASENAPFQIEPVEEKPQAIKTPEPESFNQASGGASAEGYSDDLYQTDIVAHQKAAPELPETNVTTAEDTGSRDGFFSPNQIVNSQQDDSPPWETSGSEPQQEISQSPVVAGIPEAQNAAEDYFSPEAGFSHEEQEATQTVTQAATQTDYAPQFLPDSGEQYGMEGTEKEWQSTDTEMSVDFDIPFAVDGKKVTKASQLDTWSQLIERAGLGGLTKQLALNSNYFNDGEHIKLVVSRTQNHLMSENAIKTIEESISGAIQQPIKLQAHMGEVMDTPAAVQKAINEMRQQHAEKTIQQDSAVADICHSFSGTVLQDTIKPR